jgi:hypothetical protein
VIQKYDSDQVQMKGKQLHAMDKEILIQKVNEVDRQRKRVTIDEACDRNPCNNRFQQMTKPSNIAEEIQSMDDIFCFTDLIQHSNAFQRA